jgi:hypothetical protein
MSLSYMEENYTDPGSSITPRGRGNHNRKSVRDILTGSTTAYGWVEKHVRNLKTVSGPLPP